MTTTFANHPCFNAEKYHSTGRIHLPVAPTCNVQCHYCERQGVTNVVLQPVQALTYLESVLEQIDNIAVVGIAGPGDPLATPEETFRTMELVHEKYPDKTLCLSTNGLELPEYVDEIARLHISHVTITLNTIDPETGSKLYAWVRHQKRPYRGIAGAELLLNRQAEAIKKLRTLGIAIKINTVVIRGVNDKQIGDVARFCKEAGADVQNCIPMMPVDGTPFEDIPIFSQEEMLLIQKEAEQHLPQMTHCVRCRADAVGMIGTEYPPDEIERLLQDARIIRTTQNRPHVAVASMDGLQVNRHLGESSSLWIYAKQNGQIVAKEQRNTPPPGTGNLRWQQLAETFKDCTAILVSGCGQPPKKILEHSGIHVITAEGLIADILPPIFNGTELPKVELPKGMSSSCRCGTGKTCTGTETGCG
jgi:nitrogen fixation protein NifB